MKKKLRGKSTIKSVVDGQSLKSRSGLDRWDSCEAAAAVAGQLMMTGSKTLLPPCGGRRDRPVQNIKMRREHVIYYLKMTMDDAL